MPVPLEPCRNGPLWVLIPCNSLCPVLISALGQLPPPFSQSQIDDCFIAIVEEMRWGEKV